MDQRYTWRAPAPGETLSVHIESSEDGDARVRRHARPQAHGRSRARSLARVTARHPAATLRMLALIYGHALALKLKGVPVQPHPGSRMIEPRRAQDRPGAARAASASAS